MLVNQIAVFLERAFRSENQRGIAQHCRHPRLRHRPHNNRRQRGCEKGARRGGFHRCRYRPRRDRSRRRSRLPHRNARQTQQRGYQSRIRLFLFEDGRKSPYPFQDRRRGQGGKTASLTTARAGKHRMLLSAASRAEARFGIARQGQPRENKA